MKWPARELCDSIRPERVSTVMKFGFNELQARFLLNVLVYSGVFIERQYRAFTGAIRTQRRRRDGRPDRFWQYGGNGSADVKTINKSGQESGGEAGIRTLGRDLNPYNGLANRRFRPLSHLTATSKCT